MEIDFSVRANEDLLFWKKSCNKAIQNKIEKLLISIAESPFEGIGKPEPLKYSYSGCWSRRINEEHRIVYTVIENIILILSLKGHYS